MKRAQQQLATLASQLDELKQLEGDSGRTAAGVSGWSVGHHSDHISRTLESVARAMGDPPSTDHPPLSLIGRLVLTLGWIPRGKGKAPKSMRPEDGCRVSTEQLDAALQAMRSASTPQNLESQGATAAHPYFGGLSPKHWLRFATIHTEHHLKIVREIVRRAD